MENYRSETVYVASSWRNLLHSGVVHTLRAAGFEVYDFKNPPNGAGFGWEQVALRRYTYATDGRTVDAPPKEGIVKAADYLAALKHPRAVEGFGADYYALNNADIVILVLPCGRSAHLELGWAVGVGKRTAILLDGDEVTPELMYKLVDHISPNLFDLLGWLGVQD